MTRLLKAAVFAGCLGAGSANALTLDDLVASMHESGDSSWTARETRDFQSDAPLSTAFAGAGAIEEDEAALRQAEPRNVFGESFLESADLPPSYDWRSVDGQNYMPPVGIAQGQCGSCVAFATMATLESTLNIACNTPSRPFALSRQHFFSCGGGRCSGGWKMSEAMSYLQNEGVPDQGCFPYMSADGADAPCNLTCSDAGRRLVKDISIKQPTRGFIDIPSIKRAVLQAPVLANMILYEDLEFYGDGVYRHVSGNKLGSHAVAIVGWDDADQAWIVRNSWGPSWGDGGYFKAAFDDAAVLLGRYTWSMDTSGAESSGICQFPR